MDLDEDQLLKVLLKLESDLTIPYLERRAREHQHRPSLTEELRDLANAISERERELIAAIGIAKMLVSKGKSTLTALDEAREQAEVGNRTVRGLKQEVEILREALLLAEEKQEKTAKLLMEAEEKQEKLSGQWMKYEENLRILKKQKACRERDTTVSDLQCKLHDQQDSYDSNLHLESVKLLCKDNSKLQTRLQQLEFDLQHANDSLAKAKLETATVSKKLSESQGKVRTLQGKLKDYDEQVRTLVLDLSLAHRKIERLTEELNVGSPLPQGEKVKTRRMFSRSFIGIGTCDSGEDSELESESEEEPQERSGCLCAVSPPSLSLCPQQLHLFIPPKPSRRDPGQEYFALVLLTQVSQAVKLNSPYMDTICTVPTKELYDKALKACIPFHKVRVT